MGASQVKGLGYMADVTSAQGLTASPGAGRNWSSADESA
jgi:hypothetical protein